MDKQTKKTRAQKRQAFRKAVRELLREYVAEAEHQDGVGYWDHFSTTREAVEDFGTYVQHRENADLE